MSQLSDSDKILLFFLRFILWCYMGIMGFVVLGMWLKNLGIMD